MNFLQQSSQPSSSPKKKANGAANKPAVSITVETVSPELATRYLEFSNEGNRLISEPAVFRFRKDINEGRWSLTGEPIIFDNSGMLIDGHHRLTALAGASVPINLVVVRGVEPSAVDRIDTGRARSAAQIAFMGGTQNAHVQCAAIYMILIHERHGIERLKHPLLTPSKSEVVDELKRRDLTMHARAAGKTKKDLPPSVGTFLHYIFYQQNPVAADRFWDELGGNGAGLEATNPVLHLRNRLAENRSAKAKLPKLEVIALAFRAWAAYRDNKPMKVLRWRSDGPSPEPFPTIEGRAKK